MGPSQNHLHTGRVLLSKLTKYSIAPTHKYDFIKCVLAHNEVPAIWIEGGALSDSNNKWLGPVTGLQHHSMIHTHFISFIPRGNSSHNTSLIISFGNTFDNIMDLHLIQKVIFYKFYQFCQFYQFWEEFCFLPLIYWCNIYAIFETQRKLSRMNLELGRIKKRQTSPIYWILSLWFQKVFAFDFNSVNLVLKGM